MFENLELCAPFCLCALTQNALWDLLCAGSFFMLTGDSTNYVRQKGLDLLWKAIY